MANVVAIGQEPKQRNGMFSGVYAVPDDIDSHCQDDVEAMFSGMKLLPDTPSLLWACAYPPLHAEATRLIEDRSNELF